MADPIEIPVALDTPLYVERTTLDGREFQLRFDYNGREDRWYLDIITVDGQNLAMGIKLVANWPLLRRFTDPRLPQGNLMAIDFSPLQGQSPGFADMGRRVLLTYFPAVG